MRTELIRTCQAIALAGALCAQTAAPDPRFEVASVKRENAGTYEYTGGRPNIPMRGISGLRVDFQGETIMSLVSTAYAIDARLISGPDWVEKGEGRYRIGAVMPAGSGVRDVAPMIKTLLRERFHLVAHRVMAEKSGYALTVSRKGAKLREGRALDESECPTEWTGALRGRICRFDQFAGNVRMHTSLYKEAAYGPALWQIGAGEWHEEFYSITMPKLAALLSTRVEPPSAFHAFGPTAPYVVIVDQTTLQGEWDVVVDTDRDDGELLPSIVSSLEKQGLTLTHTTVPVEKLVIDQVDRIPTEN